MLSLLLICSTSGVAISQHFCGDTLKEVSVSPEHKTCCKSGDEATDCCDNEITWLKAESSQLAQFNINLEFVPFILYALNLPDLGFINNLLFKSFPGTAHYPPLISTEPIFIKVQSFLL